MRVARIMVFLLLIVAAFATLMAQTPPTASATDTTATDTSTTAGSVVQQTLQEILEEPATTDSYRYDPQGRRDPFKSLVGPREPRLQEGQRPPGARGFLIDEMKLQGVVKTKQGLIAMVSGPDNKGYIIRAGDKVLDGEVIRLTPTSVVFRQEVNDPTRIERFREVVKDLTPEGSKKAAQ